MSTTTALGSVVVASTLAFLAGCGGTNTEGSQPRNANDESSSDAQPSGYRTPPPAPPAAAALDPKQKMLIGVKLINAEVPTWPSGGAAILFVTGAPAGPFSTIYETTQRAEQINARSTSTAAYLKGDAGWFVIVSRGLHEGKFRCDGEGAPVVFAVSTEKDFQGSAANTLWSDNPGATCEVTLSKGKFEGDYEGAVTARFVTNDATDSVTVPSTYFYLKSVPNLQYVPSAPGPTATYPSAPSNRSSFKETKAAPPQRASTPARLVLPR